MKKIILFSLIFFYYTQFATAQSGAGLDPSFGNRGIVSTDAGAKYDYNSKGQQVLINPDQSFYIIINNSPFVSKRFANGNLDSSYGSYGYSATIHFGFSFAALQQDGKIVFVGNDYNILGAIGRMNTNGTIDSTFGLNGVQMIGYTPRSVTVQNDGKILVTGGGSNGFVLSRYNADGSADISFNGNGTEITQFVYKIPPQDKGEVDSETLRSGTANAIIVQPDGKILVGGTAYTTMQPDYASVALARYNKNGTLDSTFDDDGTEIFKVGGLTDDADFLLLLQPDLKIVLACNSADHFVLARCNPNGHLDSSFNGTGKQTLSMIGLSSPVRNIAAIQSDGKIVVAGYAQGTSYNDFAVARIKANGILDSSFDGDGILNTDFNSEDDYANSVAVQSDGKIIAVGYSYPATGGQHLAAARYNSNGSLDNSFNHNGKLDGDYQQGNSTFYASAVQSDGKLVTAGSTWNGSNFDFALARYNTDGSLDNTFSGDGEQTTDFGGDDGAASMAIQGDGKIIVVGNTTLARYNTDGSLDNSFNGNGKLILNVNVSVNSIALQTDGKIILAGSSSAGDFAVIRLNVNGTFDHTFGQAGVVRTDIGNSFDDAASVAIQKDGKIVVAGRSVPTVPGNVDNFSIARYNSDGSLDNTFSGDGKEINSFGSDEYFGASVAIQDDGKIIIGGSSEGNNGFSAFVLARYNANGNLDSAFGINGAQITPLGGLFYGGYSVALKNDGRIALGGSDGKGNFTVLLYKVNGSLDSSFSKNGIETTNVGVGGIDCCIIRSVAITNDALYGVGYGSFPGTVGAVAKYLLPENKAPVVKIITPANNAVYTAPAKFTVTAAATDSDGLISYVKFYNGGTFLSTDSTSPYSYTTNNLAVGNYSFVAKAIDNNGLLSSSQSVGITVSAATNKAPVVRITSPANNVVYNAPASITINAAATDSDGIVKYVKFYNGGTLLGTDSTSPYSFTLNNVMAGNYSFVAKAIDDKGLLSSSSGVAAAVSVTTNKAPTVSINSPGNNAVYYRPVAVTISSSANDVDGTIGNVKFYNGATLVKTDSTSPYDYTFSNPVPGTYSITAKATDNKGLSNSSASVTISVLDSPNVAPVISLTNPVNNAVYYAPASVTLTANATDANGISSVNFYSGATLLKADTSSPYDYPISNLAAGNYFFTAKATDRTGLFNSSSSVHVTVLSNKAPVVNVHTDDSVYTAPANIQISAEASDTDGTINYVDFYNGTTLLGRDSTSPYHYSWNNPPQGSYAITAKAVDNHNLATSSKTVHVTVKATGSLEAEDALLSGALIASSVPGYTGTGYADYVNASGDFIEWTYNAPNAGTFMLKFRYANGASNRPLQLKINGVVVNAGLAFVPTGAWSTWSVSATSVNLNTGINKIRLTTIGSNGPNVDNLSVASNTSTLEAEDGVLHGAVIASGSTGYTGTGYADYINASGDFIEWTADALTSGSYLLQFRYGNGGTGDRPLQLQVNGTVVNSGLNFMPTGAWTNWSVSSAMASLVAGSNKIRLTTIGSNGPNVDNLSFGSNSAGRSAGSFASKNNLLLQPPGILKAVVSPNPVTGIAKLVVTTSSDLPINLMVVDMAGRKYESARFRHVGSNNFDFSAGSLSAGSYIIVVMQGNLTTHVKLVVAK